jgi:hypothetical protein
MKPIKFGLITSLLIVAFVIWSSAVAFAVFDVRIEVVSDLNGKITYRICNDSTEGEEVRTFEIEVGDCCPTEVETRVGWTVGICVTGTIAPWTIGDNVVRWTVETGNPIAAGTCSEDFSLTHPTCRANKDWGAKDNGNSEGEYGNLLSLPVELSSFVATTSNGKVTLRWRTETEVNNVGFTIYRSEKKDGKFVKVNDKLVPGQGNKVMPTDYKYVDKTAKPGKVYYYYLEDIDVEGNREKSDIVQSRSKRKLAVTWAKLKRR